jgi:4-amino-4-deoxy-L-arabinose transferase-like glycosyltransferase
VTRTAFRGSELLRLLPLLALYLAVLAAFPAHADDEASYVDLAHRLTAGTYVTGDDDALLDADPTSTDLWFGPGLPAVLAPLVAAGAPLSVLRLAGPLFLFAAVIAFYALARRRWSSSVSLSASYALGLYPPFWPLLSNLHSEPLAVLFVVLAMLGLAGAISQSATWGFVLAPLALAGLALTRVAYGWVLTLVLVASALAAVTRRRPTAIRLAVVVGAALLLCTPWLAYTQAKTDRPLQWGNSGALSLYWMASPFPGDSGDWRQADDVFSDPALERHRPFFASLRGLSLAQQNDEIERRAVANIVDHPLAYAGNIAANVSRLLANWPYSDSDWDPNDVFYAVSNAAVVAAILFSLITLLPRRATLPPETGAFVLLGVTALVLHLLVSTYPRMLAPIIPLVVWLTTLAVVETGTHTAITRFARRKAEPTASS